MSPDHIEKQQFVRAQLGQTYMYMYPLEMQADREGVPLQDAASVMLSSLSISLHTLLLFACVYLPTCTPLSTSPFLCLSMLKQESTIR